MAASLVSKLSACNSLFFLRFPLSSSTPPLSFNSLSFFGTPLSLQPKLHPKPYSSSSSPYPLQFDLIISRPNSPSSPRSKSHPQPHPSPDSHSHSDSDSPEPQQPLNFHDWVDNKLAQHDTLDHSKKKYYNKRRKRMYGSDSDDETRRQQKHGGFVELTPEVVDFPTLHKREQELFFYDTFAMPWEKDKHYKMVYQLEKKYFPDQCLDNAFLQPHQQPTKRPNDNDKDKDKDNGLVFFDDKDGNPVEDLSDKKVEEFFRCLKKVPGGPNAAAAADVEPFLACTTTGLPPKWDTPAGTVLLVNKPKGWTSFIVCGKLRRLTKVKKVGHAGTLDPMATGLLIVCVGKSTKLVDRYQGMIKGYSGVFRLGEATSTWDADSPVIQREPWEHIKDEDIKKAVASFTGEIWQVPPMFSAIKVGGEKMYEKARRGESIELAPRRISIFQFDIERSLEDRQNLIFRVTCSKGTYIRSLCADFGKALGSCAHLVALRRDSIGEYTADDAYDFQELEEQITKGYF